MARVTKTSLQKQLNDTEWLLCQKDLTYFAETYWQVKPFYRDTKWAVWEPYDYQKVELKIMQQAHEGLRPRRQIRLKARQVGWTTMAMAFAAWAVIFHDETGKIVSKTEGDAKDALANYFKEGITRLPAWMRERIGKPTQDTTEKIRFKGGGELSSAPATAGAGRSAALDFGIIDEWAFAGDNGNLGKEIYAAMDPACHGVMFCFSTANGMGNYFHARWIDSLLEDSPWEGRFIPWDAVPVRDAFKKETNTEWYARKLREARGAEHLFYQEYPASPEEAFSKSGNVAFPASILKAQPFEEPSLYMGWYGINQGLRPVTAANIEEVVDLVKVWEMPPTVEQVATLAQKPNYVLAVDTAEGIESGDYNVIKIFNANTREEAASYRGHIPIEDLGYLIYELATLYLNPLVGIESNNAGTVPIAKLKELNYPRLYRMERVASVRGGSLASYGWHTNKRTKPLLVTDMRAGLRQATILLEKGEDADYNSKEAVILHDQEFLFETYSYVADKNGNYNAPKGSHDDVLVATMIAYQLMRNVGQYPIVLPTVTNPMTFQNFFHDGVMPWDEPDTEDAGYQLSKPLGVIHQLARNNQ